MGSAVLRTLLVPVLPMPLTQTPKREVRSQTQKLVRQWCLLAVPLGLWVKQVRFES